MEYDCLYNMWNTCIWCAALQSCDQWCCYLPHECLIKSTPELDVNSKATQTFSYHLLASCHTHVLQYPVEDLKTEPTTLKPINSIWVCSSLPWNEREISTDEQLAVMYETSEKEGWSVYPPERRQQILKVISLSLNAMLHLSTWYIVRMYICTSREQIPQSEPSANVLGN